MKEHDSQCVALLARQRNVSSEEMWELLSKWKYDYNTATYFLMVNRKRRGLPVRLFGPGATPFRNYRNNMVSVLLPFQYYFFFFLFFLNCNFK